MSVAFIDANRQRWPVAVMCEVLGLSERTYYAAKKRTPCARVAADRVASVAIRRVWESNYRAYGARRVRLALRREGEPIARCTVERLMGEMGICGVQRGRRPRTTIADTAAPRSPDLVDRRFVAHRPDELWVTDITYVSTWEGWLYVAFVLDVYSRAIVGWQIASHLRTELVLDAIEMAIWRRDTTGALTCHSDAGCQGELNRSSQHLTMMEVCGGATTAVGRQSASTGDAFARAAGSSASCRARVLASDCSRQEHRGRRSRHRGVGPRRVTLVSPRWRHGAFEPHRTDRPVLVVR